MLRKFIFATLFALITSSLYAVNVYKNEDGSTFDINGRVVLVKERLDDIETRANMENGSSRLTISGTKAINSDFAAYGYIEWGYDPLSTSDLTLTNRLGYLGIKYKGNHKFQAGRGYASYYDNVAVFTDEFWWNGTEATGVIGGDYEVNGTLRTNSYVYTGQFDKLQLGLTYMPYQKFESGNERDWGYAASLVYDFTNELKTGVAVQQAKAVGKEDLALLTVAGFRFENDMFLVSSVVTYQDNVADVDVSGLGVEVYAAYKYWRGSQVYGGINFLQEDNNIDSYQAVNALIAGADFRFLEGYNFFTFLEYKLDLRPSEDRALLSVDDRENNLALGIRYSF